MTQRLQQAGQAALMPRTCPTDAVSTPHRSRSTLAGHDLQQRSSQRQNSVASRGSRTSTPRAARASKTDLPVAASRQGLQSRDSQLHEGGRASRHGLSNQERASSGSRTPARRFVVARPKSGSSLVAPGPPGGARATRLQSRSSGGTHRTSDPAIQTAMSVIGDTLRKTENVLPLVRPGSSSATLVSPSETTSRRDENALPLVRSGSSSGSLVSPNEATQRKDENALPLVRSGSSSGALVSPSQTTLRTGEHMLPLVRSGSSSRVDERPVALAVPQEGDEPACAVSPTLELASAKADSADPFCVSTIAWRSASDWFDALFGFREESYAETRRRLKATPHRNGFWSLQGENGVRYKAGRFSTPNLSELEMEVAKLGGMGALHGRVRVRNVKGDVAEFHSQEENRHATFQVASQFNCLEFPGPRTTPEDGITKYVFDRTQGPACSVACGPATALRNYFIDVGGESGQTCDRQVENLRGMLAELGESSKHITVRNGYTFADDKGLMAVRRALQDSASLRKSCQQGLRVGVHEDVQVTASAWGNCQQRDPDHTVTQVFGSACSVAYSKNGAGLWASFAQLVLFASYEATLWAGLLNALRHDGRAGSRRVFLTCLGGGVFGNPMSWIADAMQAALEKFARVNLEVFIVTYCGPIPDALEDLERRFGSGS